MSQWLWQWLRLPGWPVLPHRLWLTLGGLAFCLGNLLGKKEVWPHTPMSEPCFLTGAWLAFVCALPQLAWVSWRWLLAWHGPLLLRWLATAVFLAGTGVAVVLWLVLVIMGLYSLASGRLLS